MVCKVNHCILSALRLSAISSSQNRDNQAKPLHNKMSVFPTKIYLMFVNVLFHGNKYAAEEKKSCKWSIFMNILCIRIYILFIINLLLERQKIIKYK